MYRVKHQPCESSFAIHMKTGESESVTEKNKQEKSGPQDAKLCH